MQISVPVANCLHSHALGMAEKQSEFCVKASLPHWKDSPLFYIKGHWKLDVLSKQKDGDDEK